MQNFLKEVLFFLKLHVITPPCYKKGYNHLFIIFTYLSTRQHTLKPVPSTLFHAT